MLIPISVISGSDDGRRAWREQHVATSGMPFARASEDVVLLHG